MNSTKMLRTNSWYVNNKNEIGPIFERDVFSFGLAIQQFTWKCITEEGDLTTT